MTNNDTCGLTEEAFIREVATRVIRELINRRRTALVIYTGAKIGSETSLDSLRALKAEGFTLRVLFSRSAARVLDVDAICAVLEPEKFWVEPVSVASEELVSCVDTIIIPALTVRTAACVAACIPDTLAGSAILAGLMQGKTVIAAIDGCCPDNGVRAELGYHMAEPLKQTLRDNIEKLRSYGLTFTYAKSLCEKTLRSLNLQAPRVQGVKAKEYVAASSLVRFEGKVLSQSFIRGCAPSSVVRISQETLVTQLALDEARKRTINIVKQA